MKYSFVGSRLLLGALIVGALSVGISSSHAVWQLTWSDEFDGTNVDTTKWTFETGNNNGWGNSEREYYTGRTNNAYVANGLLHIVARQESMGGFPYTSARMKSQGLFSQTYGKFEFRAKLPQGVGFWPALWMMGTNIASVGWPACGEMDVMESNGSYPNQAQGTLHYSDASNNHLQQTRIYSFPGDYVTNFHTYAVEWSTNLIRWVIDGVAIQAWTSWSSSTGPYPAPYNKPFFILMNMAIGGSYLGFPTDAQINSGTVFPGEMQVDYVRVYQDVPATGPPAQVTGLTASATASAVYLGWNTPSGASAYNVKRSSNSGGPYVTINSPLLNSFTDTGVSGCSSYYYVVSGTNSFGEGTNSSEVAVTLPSYALAINSGGSNANQFVTDAYFSGGTQAASVTTTIDTSGVVSPAPQPVYQTERYGNCTYTFPGLIAGRNYLLRLHFAETYWTAAGQRRFNVFINGVQVLTNFDIIVAAGAPNKAVVKEFAAIPSVGQIVVQYVTVTDNAKSSGIELLLPPPPAPAGLNASAGDSHVDLKWNASSGGVTYNVKRASSYGGPYNLLTNGLAVTNYSDLGLSNGVTYFYVVSDGIAGCEGTNSTPVSATPICSAPQPPVAGNNGPIWAGMTLNLTASSTPGATYNWAGPNAFVSTNQNPSISNAPVNAGGDYTVTITVGSCTSAPILTTASINPIPPISLQFADGNAILSWPAGTLQSTTNLPGIWEDVIGATSPYTNPPAVPQLFYRLKLP